MRGAISDEVLSIVREMVSMNAANVTLPSNAVEAMINRIDRQDKMLRAYRVLVACHDNYLSEVDKPRLCPNASTGWKLRGKSWPSWKFSETAPHGAVAG